MAFLQIIVFRLAFSAFSGILAVAVVRLVIQHQNVLHAHEFRHDTLEHLPFGFQGLQYAVASLKQKTPASGQFQAFSQLEGMKIGDDDFGPLEFPQHALGDQLPVLIVTIRIVRL